MKTFIETTTPILKNDPALLSDTKNLKGSFQFNELAALHENSEGIPSKEVSVRIVDHDDGLDEFIARE